MLSCQPIAWRTGCAGKQPTEGVPTGLKAKVAPRAAPKQLARCPWCSLLRRAPAACARRSKLAASVLAGVDNIHIKPGLKVLYLGAASGTSVSHVSDIVGPDGAVYAVEYSHRSGARARLSLPCCLCSISSGQRPSLLPYAVSSLSLWPAWRPLRPWHVPRHAAARSADAAWAMSCCRCLHARPFIGTLGTVPLQAAPVATGRSHLCACRCGCQQRS